MSYCYETEKPRIFTEDGSRDFLKMRDAAHELLEIAGAFRQQEVIHRSGVTGDSWLTIAYVDRLVELGEIVELKRDCWGQYKVYTSPKAHNL
jgi:hypothetical protein